MNENVTIMLDLVFLAVLEVQPHFMVHGIVFEVVL
jgi:hypothetical protein